VVEAQRAARDTCIAQGGANCGLDLGLTTILTPKLLLALGALGLVSLVPVIAKRLFGNRLRLPGGQA
jgi:hypothetical protein